MGINTESLPDRGPRPGLPFRRQAISEASANLASDSQLTPKQLALSQFVAEYHVAHGLGLSAGEIAHNCHISKSVAWRRIERLVGLGVLTRIAGRPYSIRPGTHGPDCKEIKTK